MSDVKTDFYFIVNPRAGSGKTMFKWIPAEKRLEAQGISFVTAMTDHKRHATQLAMEAAAQGYRRIVAVGGDGSLHEVFNGICRWCEKENVPTEEFYLAVIPIGSGNDWIKSLGVENDADEALDAVLSGRSRKMDVTRVLCGNKTLYMANVGGVGFDSRVCLRVNSQKESGRRGSRIYINALIHTILNMRTIRVACVSDGETVFSGECYSIAFGNGKYSGGGMRQVPNARIDDALMDYMIVPRVSLGRIALEVPRIFNGTVDESKYIIYGKCRHFDIMPLDNESTEVLELDGELVGRIPASLEISGGSINVMCG